MPGRIAFRCYLALLLLVSSAFAQRINDEMCWNRGIVASCEYELWRIPQSLKTLTSEDINSIFGPTAGHVIQRRNPDGTLSPGLIPELVSGDLVSGSRENISVPCIEPVNESPVVGSVEPTREEWLRELAHQYDLIVLGTAGPVTSYMLPDGGFLFSMMPFRINDAVKNNSGATVRSGGTITVGREGGVLRVGDKTVSAVCHSFVLFQPGKQYLVFLKHIPKTDVYVAKTAFQFVDDMAATMQVRKEEEQSYGGGPGIAGMRKDELLQLLKRHRR